MDENATNKKAKKIRETVTEPPPFKNTDENMHAKNREYTSKCILCSHADRFMVSHYGNYHSESEVFISRPSPKMAQQIRSQSTAFELKKGNHIVGLCYFCEEKKKTFGKAGWLTHLCTHTGEKLLDCSKCKMRFIRKQPHNECDSSNIKSIFEFDDENGFSIFGYMCNKCNYLQLTESKLVQHIKNEHVELHGYPKQFYDKLFLIKDPSIGKTSGKFTIF